MSTFAEYKKKRPADPALVAQYKATMQYQLDRQHLADIITKCMYGDEPLESNECYLFPPEELADAIIQAGWTAPELSKPFDADCKTCGLERQEALENAGQGFWHIRMFLCPNCGNKRCPKAENHRHKCTGSNEPNQTPTLEN